MLLSLATTNTLCCMLLPRFEPSLSNERQTSSLWHSPGAGKHSAARCTHLHSQGGSTCSRVQQGPRCRPHRKCPLLSRTLVVVAGGETSSGEGGVAGGGLSRDNHREIAF